MTRFERQIEELKASLGADVDAALQKARQEAQTDIKNHTEMLAATQRQLQKAIADKEEACTLAREEGAGECASQIAQLEMELNKARRVTTGALPELKRVKEEKGILVEELNEALTTLCTSTRPDKEPPLTFFVLSRFILGQCQNRTVDPNCR